MQRKPATISHVISGCKIFAVNIYTFRHNQVATYLHWNIIKDKGFNVLENWLQHRPIESVIKEKSTITQDMKIITGTK